MHRIPDLIRLLDAPEDADAFDRAFGESDPLDIDDGLLPHEDDQPFILREVVSDELAAIGPDAREALPALLRCAGDMTDSTVAKSMRLAAVTAMWKISGDPSVCIPICERLLLDRECWFRRHVVELLEEIADPAALPALRERLADVRPEVRQAAVRAIEKTEVASRTDQERER